MGCPGLWQLASSLVQPGTCGFDGNTVKRQGSSKPAARAAHCGQQVAPDEIPSDPITSHAHALVPPSE